MSIFFIERAFSGHYKYQVGKKVSTTKPPLTYNRYYFTYIMNLYCLRFMLIILMNCMDYTYNL